MSRIEGRKFDWETPMSLAEPFISSSGGIIVISGYETSACNSFAKLIRDEIKSRNAETLFIQINPINETTHTPDDLIVFLEDELNIDTHMASNIASNIKAFESNEVGGNMEAHLNIYTASDPSEISRKKFQRIKRIIQTIEQEVLRRRIVIIIYNYHKMRRETAEWLWSRFWIDRLEGLATRGLLILCAYEGASGGLTDDDSVPTPYSLISMPATYENADRQHVIRDVTNCLVREANMAPGEAGVLAENLLDDWKYQPSKVQARILWRIKFNLRNSQ
jgi:hypothetical protein